MSSTLFPAVSSVAETMVAIEVIGGKRRNSDLTSENCNKRMLQLTTISATSSSGNKMGSAASIVDTVRSTNMYSHTPAGTGIDTGVPSILDAPTTSSIRRSSQIHDLALARGQPAHIVSKPSEPMKLSYSYHAAALRQDAEAQLDVEYVYDHARVLASIACAMNSYIATTCGRIEEQYVSMFHAQNVPSISIASYLKRMVKFTKMTTESLMHIYILLGRIVSVNMRYKCAIRAGTTVDFTWYPVPLTNIPLEVNKLTVHRILAVLSAIVMKYGSDVHYNNAFVAKVGGIELREFNRLEMDLLELLNFDLHVDYVEYTETWKLLARTHESCVHDAMRHYCYNDEALPGILELTVGAHSTGGEKLSEMAPLPASATPVAGGTVTAASPSSPDPSESSSEDCKVVIDERDVLPSHNSIIMHDSGICNITSSSQASIAVG
jgi:hypothetical protein